MSAAQGGQARLAWQRITGPNRCGKGDRRLERSTDRTAWPSPPYLKTGHTGRVVGRAARGILEVHTMTSRSFKISAMRGLGVQQTMHRFVPFSTAAFFSPQVTTPYFHRRGLSYSVLFLYSIPIHALLSP